ncbi:MAG: Sec-independent protein translocase protein TatB [Gammaproteobacteria bacterium]|nr:Sec-independent protein translocase protein TatB [Gammaproteobacteria bacterium]
MFGIGFQELVLLSLIGLIVLGPERLPRVANQIGGWLGQARRMTRVMKRQLEDELNFEKDRNIKPPDREPSKQPLSDAPDDDDYYSAAHDAGEPVADIGDTSKPGTNIDDAGEYENEDDLAVTTANRNDVETTDEVTVEKSEADVPEEQDTKEAS